MRERTIKRILNCIPSKETKNDWNFKDAIAAKFAKPITAIPASVDLRENWWKINDQGQTGSCVGWATADALLRWHFVKKKQLGDKNLLSVRFIWMSAKETDEFNERPSTFIEVSGTSLKAALDIARKYGCVTDQILPFDSNKSFMGDENEFYALASRFRIRNYFNLGQNNVDKIRVWKEWIAAGNGPILVRLDVDDTWQNAGVTNGNLDIYLEDTQQGGHAVAIVGYTVDRLIIRNSWGATSWGDNGYAYASIPYAQMAFTEAYGITV
ncbi:hypothetical protein EZ428_01240 [Pedobacter frigiditerrae]|uniref:Peptidase C1A papain C-terminal domain-containing protein n=1 Tax=Pedobacter frigiditerrae TaxID=2530452 RepID=A0A4R0N179_9SPHI|nr:C1 family peptidase [Pedobacter frigiditerrae]TCC93425.1 hypothetical protein EZ428_01240 [Pedobacter frigiditerrae]